MTIAASSSVLANPLESEILTTNVKLGENITIEVLDDGRVAPIEYTDMLEEEYLDLVLEKIGHPVELIERIGIERKKQLASYGGKVIDMDNSQFKHEYVSNDGEVYEITPSNIKQIRKMQLQDMKEQGIDFKKDKDKFSTMGTITDGNFDAVLRTLKVGETSTQYEYVMIMDYTWDPAPLTTFSNMVGLHWGSYGQPVANTARGEHMYSILGSVWDGYYHDIDTSSNYGVTSEFPLHGTAGYEMGYLEETIMISKDYTDHQLTLSARYVRPISPNNLSISVGYGGFTLSGVGTHENWTWRVNFTPTEWE